MEKYDPKKIEEEISKFWKERGIPEIIVNFDVKSDKKKFFLLDGPPYVNGVPHAGHVKTTTTKDIWSKFKTMQGFQSWWQPGFDCGGLPIENAVEKKLGIKSKQDITEKIGLDKFIEECKNMSVGNKQIWLDVYKKMGAWRGWVDPYMTYYNSYLESGWWTVKQMYEKGLFFEGYKPGHWCPHCETVLTGYEVSDSYGEVEDTSIFFKCKLKDKEGYLLVWTTTPWTLPANTAVLVHPDENYVRVEVMGESLWIAEKRLSVLSEFEMGFTVKETVLGKDMEGWEYEPILDVPIQHNTKNDNFRKVILSKPIMKKRVASKTLVKGDSDQGGDEFGHLVEMDTGTGMVHIAPGHGAEDNRIGKEYNLPELSPIDDQGKLTEEAGQFAGKFAKDADKDIIKYLEDKNLLLKAIKIKHSYPLCWRCKSPLLFRMSRQWFLNVEKIRDKMLKFNKEVKWLPEFARERMDKVLEDAPDWAITRQRFWGIPAPVWKCDKCGNIKVIGSRDELKENAIGEVGEDLHKNSVDKIHFKCEKCAGQMTRISDIMDVWFDSGISPWASTGYPHKNKELFEKLWPVDMICESQDQVRGWFYALLFMATSTFDEKPYESVSMTGWTLDEKGNKMSKSLGNVVYAEDALKELGADILRYYYCWGVPPWETQNFSMNVAKELRRVLDVLWNTAMFIEMYADKSLIDKKFEMEKFRNEDKYIISKTNSIIKKYTGHLENFELNFAGRLLGDFILNDFSRWYIKSIRNRMSPWYEEADKEEAQFTLYYVLENIIRLLAPIAPFITEKIYRRVYFEEGKPESIHLSSWPVGEESLIKTELEASMDIVKEIIESVNSLRQEQKIKLKWPVSEITIETEEEKVRKAVESLGGIITEMGNAKNVKTGKTAGATGEFTGGKISLGKVIEDEALVRELSRHIQVKRKKEGLNVTDKIELFIKAEEEAEKMLKGLDEELKKSVGASVIHYSANEPLAENKANVMGKLVKFGFKKG